MHIRSKDRVIKHGEVFTSEKEVEAMLELVKNETDRIDSRFFEPACGTGNFLIGILRRKLDVVESRYKNSQLEYERYAVIAISSLYGVDILQDNVFECRHRLFRHFNKRYTQLFNGHTKDDCRESVMFILQRNILWGDALTMKSVCERKEPIIFSEWSAVNGSMIKRRDYFLSNLLACHLLDGLEFISDLGEQTFIPTPVKEFPLIHFLRLNENV